jgi:hypothetical protein
MSTVSIKLFSMSSIRGEVDESDDAVGEVDKSDDVVVLSGEELGEAYEGSDVEIM